MALLSSSMSGSNHDRLSMCLALPRFILMEADSEMTPWTRICVSHADCILLVGAEDAVFPVCSFLSLCGAFLAWHRAFSLKHKVSDAVGMVRS